MVRRPVHALASGLAVTLLSWGVAGPAWADPTPSPVPTPTAGSASPDPTAPVSPTPAGPSTSAPPTSAPRTDEPAPVPVDGAPLTLGVTPQGGPLAGVLVEDLGSFGLTGTAALPDGSTVRVERLAGSRWTPVATTTATAGAYATSLPVQAAGPVTLRSSATGTEGAELTSSPVTVTVRDSTVSVAAAAKVDSLKALTVRGAVTPARAGVEVHVDVRNGSRWSHVATATTAADGTYLTSTTYGESRLKRYGLRATFRAVNRPRWEYSGDTAFTRIAVLDATVDGTTRADVAKTYRKGCPVGPSKLSTIHLNYYGFDKRMHRGVIIVRTDLRQEIVRGFGSALKHRFPLAKMKNPNAYGGNDPRQMKANNTSGFNCRKVVGNPYKTSPHSYGIAIDVNTVQNPYRDARGKWWPSNGKKYRDRSPLRKGMLGKRSALTKSLAKDHFFWGGRWNPGRDYQHFEHRG